MTDKQASIEAAEKVYSDWAAGFATADLDKIVALYAPDAVLESPLVNVLLKTDDGIVTGR